VPVAGEQALDCARADPLFPLRVRLCIESGNAPETIGWLLLGPRPDGSFFGKDEREAIEHIAGPVARAIHIAQLREQRDEQAEMRIGALESLIAKLAEAIGAGPAKGAAQV
jgi:GAF domain-containing protein